MLCLSKTRYPTFQRRDIFTSLASLHLWKDAKDTQRQTGHFPDADPSEVKKSEEDEEDEEFISRSESESSSESESVSCASSSAIKLTRKAWCRASATSCCSVLVGMCSDDID